MNTQLQATGAVEQSRVLFVHRLYKRYAAMLLGYIVEAVKDQALAEKYLMAVFKDVPLEIDEFSKQGVNSFCMLQVMARKKMAGFFSINAEQDAVPCDNKYTRLMTAEQRLVFCGVHWHGKTVAIMAAELSQSENAIKKILKDCFTVIRSST